MDDIFTEKEIEYLLNVTDEDIKRYKEDREGDMWLTFIDTDTGKPFSVCVNERKGITLENYPLTLEKIKRQGKEEKK
jgi:hypothetical protein